MSELLDLGIAKQNTNWLEGYGVQGVKILEPPRISDQEDEKTMEKGKYITDHKSEAKNDRNKSIVITAYGGRGKHRPSSHYVIRLGFQGLCDVSFPSEEQQGLTEEALLAVVVNRLKELQKGSLANKHKLKALDHCLEALKELKSQE